MSKQVKYISEAEMTFMIDNDINNCEGIEDSKEKTELMQIASGIKKGTVTRYNGYVISKYN